MKTAKRLLTLALALCMLIGIPFAVSATDSEFKIESVVEAPYELDWEQVTFNGSYTKESVISSFVGRVVIVNFNNTPREDALANLTNGTIKPKISTTGTVKSDYMTGNYIGRYGSNAILLAPGGTEKTFDIMRTESGYTNSQGMENVYVVFECSGDTDKDGLMDYFCDVDNTPLSLNPNAKSVAMEARTPLAVINVSPLADSEVLTEADKGRIWLITFNQTIATNNATFLVQALNADNVQMDFARTTVATEYCEDNVIALRSQLAVRNHAYFEELAATNNTTLGGYRVQITDPDTSRNYCVDSLISDSGQVLACVTRSNGGADTVYSDVHEVVFGAKIGDTTYATFEKAMAAAKAGETVTMLNDAVNEGPVFVLDTDVNLDLNGYTLTADNFMAFGHVTDSTDGEGKLIISKDKYTDLLADNKAMPLYDENGYRFFDYEFLYEQRASGSADVNKYYVRLGFNKAKAYELLAADANADLNIGVNLTIVKDGQTKHVNYVFSDQTIDAYAEQSADLTKTKAIILTVSGISSLGEVDLTAQAALTSPTRVNLTGALTLAQ